MNLHVVVEIAENIASNTRSCDNSYEVQIGLDPTTKLGKEVDVTSNLWEAESTDRTKEANEDAQAQR